MSSTEKAETVPEKTAAAAQKPPSDAGIQNTVYAEIPDAVKEAAKGLPVLLDLFVPVMKYPEVERQIREKSGRLYSAFTKALELKNKGGKAE